MVWLSLKVLAYNLLEYSDPGINQVMTKAIGIAVLAQNGPPCVTRLRNTQFLPLPLSHGCPGPLHRWLPHGASALEQFSLASREPLFIPVLSGTTALNSKKWHLVFYRALHIPKPSRIISPKGDVSSAALPMNTATILPDQAAGHVNQKSTQLPSL